VPSLLARFSASRSSSSTARPTEPGMAAQRQASSRQAQARAGQSATKPAASTLPGRSRRPQRGHRRRQIAFIACATPAAPTLPTGHNLTGPLVAGSAEYALGGSCLDPPNTPCGPRLGPSSASRSPRSSHKILYGPLHASPHPLAALGGFPDMCRRRRHPLRFEAAANPRPPLSPRKAIYRPRTPSAQPASLAATPSATASPACAGPPPPQRRRCALDVLALFALSCSPCPARPVLVVIRSSSYSCSNPGSPFTATGAFSALSASKQFWPASHSRAPSPGS